MDNMLNGISNLSVSESSGGSCHSQHPSATPLTKQKQKNIDLSQSYKDISTKVQERTFVKCEELEET